MRGRPTPWLYVCIQFAHFGYTVVDTWYLYGLLNMYSSQTLVRGAAVHLIVWETLYSCILALI